MGAEKLESEEMKLPQNHKSREPPRNRSLSNCPVGYSATRTGCQTDESSERAGSVVVNRGSTITNSQEQLEIFGCLGL